MPAITLPDLRAQFDMQVDFLSQVSRHTIDTLQQLSDLNMHTARRMFDEGIRLGRALASCNDPMQMGALAMRAIPPAAEGWRNWHGALVNVLTNSGATLARDANDGGWQAARGSSGSAGNLRSARAGFEDMGAAHNPT